MKSIILPIVLFLFLTGCSFEAMPQENSDPSAEETEEEESTEETEVSGNSNASSDTQSESAERASETSTEETSDSDEDLSRQTETQTRDIQTDIDVFSESFINEYFSGPHAYTFDGIEEGMTQTEIEALLGAPDKYYPVEDGEYAIYDHLAVRYSAGLSHREGLYEYIEPDRNYVTDTAVYMGKTYEEVIARYGVPTLGLSDYERVGTGYHAMIYDWTQGNGYAVYIDNTHENVMGIMTKRGEINLDRLP